MRTPLGPQAPIDARLVAGAAAFGVGWGLAGYCPGPAIVSVGLAPGRAWVFFVAMVLGVIAGERIQAPARRPSPGSERAPAC
jgi:uncharacterized membrane protein YedE/YeeE